MRAWVWVAIIVVLGAAAASWRALSVSVEHRPDVAATAEMVKRGEYLTRAGDCISCHTTQGGQAFAGGREFDLDKMGKLYTPNITPDKQTGIGAWSDDDFRAAMQLGVAPGRKHLYPVFPYASFTLASDEDVLAIKAYLFSLKPVHSTPPPNAMKFPFNQRPLLAFWSLLFNPNERFVADTRQSTEWNRGKYLVEGLGHCAECHTPRNFMQARKHSDAYAGAVAQKWFAYNISSDKQTGIGDWTSEELATYLSTGHADGRGPASGPMSEVVQNSLQFLEAPDIQSMVTYVRTIEPKSAAPAEGGSSRVLVSDSDLAYGKSIFVGICANCHRADGTGAEVSYQALKGASTLRDPHALNLMQVVLNGSGITTSGAGEQKMPAFGAGYRDSEIAAVVNYAAKQIGGHDAGLAPADIARQR